MMRMGHALLLALLLGVGMAAATTPHAVGAADAPEGMLGADRWLFNAPEHAFMRADDLILALQTSEEGLEMSPFLTDETALLETGTSEPLPVHTELALRFAFSCSVPLSNPAMAVELSLTGFSWDGPARRMAVGMVEASVSVGVGDVVRLAVGGRGMAILLSRDARHEDPIDLLVDFGKFLGERLGGEASSRAARVVRDAEERLRDISQKVVANRFAREHVAPLARAGVEALSSAIVKCTDAVLAGDLGTFEEHCDFHSEAAAQRAAGRGMGDQWSKRLRHINTMELDVVNAEMSKTLASSGLIVNEAAAEGQRAQSAIGVLHVEPLFVSGTAYGNGRSFTLTTDAPHTARAVVHSSVACSKVWSTVAAVPIADAASRVALTLQVDDYGTLLTHHVRPADLVPDVPVISVLPLETGGAYPDAKLHVRVVWEPLTLEDCVGELGTLETNEGGALAFRRRSLLTVMWVLRDEATGEWVQHYGSQHGKATPLRKLVRDEEWQFEMRGAHSVRLHVALLFLAAHNPPMPSLADVGMWITTGMLTNARRFADEVASDYRDDTMTTAGRVASLVHFQATTQRGGKDQFRRGGNGHFADDIKLLRRLLNACVSHLPRGHTSGRSRNLVSALEAHWASSLAYLRESLDSIEQKHDAPAAVGSGRKMMLDASLALTLGAHARAGLLGASPVKAASLVLAPAMWGVRGEVDSLDSSAAGSPIEVYQGFGVFAPFTVGPVNLNMVSIVRMLHDGDLLMVRLDATYPTKPTTDKAKEDVAAVADLATMIARAIEGQVAALLAGDDTAPGDELPWGDHARALVAAVSEQVLSAGGTFVAAELLGQAAPAVTIGSETRLFFWRAKGTAAWALQPEKSFLYVNVMKDVGGELPKALSKLRITGKAKVGQGWWWNYAGAMQKLVQ